MNSMEAVLIALVGIHVLYSLVYRRRIARKRADTPSGTTLVMPVPPFVAVFRSGVRYRGPRAQLGAGFQTILFLAACYLGIQYGAFSRQLVSPVLIAIGLLAGHIIFGISLLVTHRSIRDAGSHLFDLGPLWDYVVENPRVLMQYIAVSIAEEIIYRVGAQSIIIEWTGSPLVGILLMAVCFSLVHDHFFKNDPLQSAEFLGFALVLGVLYYWSGSLILVVAVHAARNIEIAFLEHLLRVEETGDEAGAVREEEFMSGERLLLMLALPACNMHVSCLEYSREAGNGRVAAASDGTSAHCGMENT